ncbi:MAG TPA: NIPSNAP family protein [Puia sp.]|nr:NIPSNAP family protein [Puia sp.]
MNRRKFVRSALLSGPALGATGLATAAGLPLEKRTSHMDNSRNPKQQWYELRVYHFANDGQRQLTANYLEQAYLPALNRAGSTAVGVFVETDTETPSPAITTPSAGIRKTFLLIPFASFESFVALEEKLARDDVYQKAGEAYLSAPATAPAYERIESNLLKAFRHMPVMELPEKKSRLFELRCYESPSESAGQKKIEMFNDAGEIDIFKKVGARPVFFGETLIGQRRPNLTYMLCFDDMEAHDAHWKAFGADPEWKKISGMPEYSDARLISKITRTFLAPAPFSQV